MLNRKATTAQAHEGVLEDEEDGERLCTLPGKWAYYQWLNTSRPSCWANVELAISS
jgi:hypothetical protein